ncbi:MAG: metallophosphoesterase family protein, partial [Candidatus Heimdallarchaeaceae archaeon]
MHRPAYSSSQRNYNGDYNDIQTLLVPIFEQYGVNVVISGHDHFYERLHKNNITYIVAGAAGAPLYEAIAKYRINESDFIKSITHSVLFDIYENQIDLRAYKMDLTLLDQLTINRISKADLRCEVWPMTTTNLTT